jgi:hypothetical protein
MYTEEYSGPLIFIRDAQRFAIRVRKNSSDHTRAVTPPAICQPYCEDRKGHEGVSMRSKLTEEWIRAIGDQQTASWDEVRVALHEFITYLDTELPVFSDGDAAKILYATLERRGKSLTIGKAILASQYVAVSSESDLRE